MRMIILWITEIKNRQKSKYHHLNTQFYLHSQGEEDSGRELSI